MYNLAGASIQQKSLKHRIKKKKLARLLICDVPNKLERRKQGLQPMIQNNGLTASHNSAIPVLLKLCSEETWGSAK
jgi:hypothetical protein